ncbi:MAG: NYN domain-containing protein [Reyranella sp.]|uniref:hypothetical protein n=1 Tax=Reyranella sp. TaxID=1929291 RepID=UPI0011F50D67|nr:hypothetical protein [Reyranella sp.]TAJ36877.1 MAG: NYN domain-containing protein [Reyranella sp.]
MLNLHFDRQIGHVLQTASKRNFLEVRRLAEKHRKSSAPNDQKVLQGALPLIRDNPEPSSWDAPAIESFVGLASFVLEQEFTQIGVSDPTDELVVSDIQNKVDWLCNLAAAGANSLPRETREEVFCLWARTRFVGGELRPSLEALRPCATDVLGALGLAQESVVDALKLSAVKYLASRAANKALNSEESAVALEWCATLALLPDVRDRLRSSLSALGIGPESLGFEPLATNNAPQAESALAPVTQTDGASIGSKESRSDAPQLRIWQMPAILPPDALDAERQDLVFEFLDQTIQKALSPRTAAEIDQISKDPNVDPQDVFFFATRDLWRAFVRSGHRPFLPLIKRISLFRYSEHLRRGTPDSRKMASAIQYWMHAQIPEKMLACEPDMLLTEAVQVYRALGLTLDMNVLRPAIVEAFAGEARARQAEQDERGCNELIADNRTAIVSLHDTYLQRMRQTRGSGKPSEEELNAFNYLTSLSGKGDHALPHLATGAVSKIIDDANFQTVINKASNRETYEYASSQHDYIRSLLQQRLKVTFEADALMRPTGAIYNQRARTKGQHDTRFAEAREALKSNDFARAVDQLTSLSERLEGRPKEIVDNYRAYALARASKAVQARLILTDLANVSSFPSVFWNLACCLPEDQADQRLDILERGLDRAPHPLLLRGVVYLALLINDTDVLRHWLPYLMVAEALLLHYQLEHEALSEADKERHVLRLARYAIEGEPNLPDPLQDDVDTRVVQDQFDKLLERNQREPIEFWLRCRQPDNQKSFLFWGLRTYYSERSGDFLGAAKAYREELRFRLVRLEQLLQQAGNPGPPGRAGNPADALRRNLGYVSIRTAEMLNRLMTPELADEGRHIYYTFTLFANGRADALKALGLEARLRGPKLESYFARAPQAQLDTPLAQQRGPGEARQRAASLSEVIIRVAAACQRDLHDIAHVAIVKRDLDELGNAYREQGYSKSAESLREVIRQLDQYRQQRSQEGKEEIWRSADVALREHEASLKRELPDQSLTLSQPICKALARTINRLPRDAKIFPKIVMEPAVPGSLTVDQSALPFVISLRLRNTSETATVRLISASATLDSGGRSAPLMCRNDFGAVPVTLDPKGTAVVTFAAAKTEAFALPGSIRASVICDFSGAHFEAESVALEVIHEEMTALPKLGPYISGRMIEPTEIEGHFFGRADEQATILESVREGQQQFQYVEGLRRTGKSSLLQSVVYEIDKQQLSIIPVYHGMGDVKGASSAGTILFNILTQVAAHPEVAACGVSAPDERRCVENMSNAYQTFTSQLAAQLPSKRVLVMVDDMQALVELGESARNRDPSLSDGIAGLLNLIRQHGRPTARLLWVFAGHLGRSQFRRMIPGVLLWPDLRGLPIDFLSRESVASILREPIKTLGIRVPDETVARLHQHSAGHPEVVQQTASIMYRSLTQERRSMMTPADADAAVVVLSSSSDDLFADTWYPAHILTKEQRDLVADLVRAVEPGGRIELFKLAKRNEMTEALKNAADDLIARKILQPNDDGTVSVRAYVLDLWLRRWVGKSIGIHQHGAPVVFLDIPNLTGPEGNPYVSGLDTQKGEGTPGRFDLGTVLDRIDRYIRTITPAERTVAWAVNYPPFAPAVSVVSGRNYLVQNIPEELHGKGSDDLVLMDKITEVDEQYPTASHFVLILGDKDYQLRAQALVKKGKFVHIISRRKALAPHFVRYAQQLPDQVTVASIEEIMEDPKLD